MPLRRCLIHLLCLMLCLLGAAPLAAQPADNDTRVALDRLRADIEAPTEPGQLTRARRELGALIVQIDAAIASHEADKAAIAAQLDQVDPDQTATATDIAQWRKSLQAQVTAIDTELVRARLRAADARALEQQVDQQRLKLFRRNVGERTTSPLLPRFWSELSSRFKDDWHRAGELAGEAAAGARKAFSSARVVFTLTGLGLALLLFLLGRRLAEAALAKLTARRPDPAQWPVSLLAAALVLVGAAVPGVAAQLAWLTLDWRDNFGPATSAVAETLVGLVWLAGLMAGLGRALLAVNRPGWRLLPISDATARATRRLPLLLALVIVLDGLWAALCEAGGVSRIGFAAGSGLIVVLAALLLVGSARRVLSRPLPEPVSATAPADVPQGLRIALGLAAAVGVVALLATAFGYVMLARLLVRQLIWTVVVGALLFLATRLVDDLARLAKTALAGNASADSSQYRFAEQATIVASAALRVLAALLALDLLLAPLGAAPLALVEQWRRLGSGFAVGQIHVAPATLFHAMLVLAVGVWLVRLLQAWLGGKLLPATRMDPGIRVSVTTLTGYVGSIVVFAFVLAALGISVERIAWVASALSVGIGFGLQAIVQNFVSGLILLVERPVRVGDRIALGDSVGDVRRINVRATELRLTDRSTLLVPNSQLITQAVRNVTPQHAQSLVTFRLPIAAGADVARVRAVLLDMLAAQPAVLKRPAPSVLLDSLDAGKIVFVVNAFIGDPRQMGAVRSELLMAALTDLQAADITLAW